MHDLARFAIVYVVGGLTFFPIILFAILIASWLWLPRVSGSGRRPRNQNEESREKPQHAAKEFHNANDETASATFAVLRVYDFPAAYAALSAKGTSNNDSKSAERPSELVAGGSSVYHSMYRSVWDRTKGSASDNITPSDEEGADLRKKRRVQPASIFFVVLRHRHLMLYETPAQIEVKQVISLAHHTISLTDGTVEVEAMNDGDLFIKRSAICLTPVASQDGTPPGRAPRLKPFYLFTTMSSQKEDFYHALLFARLSHPPVAYALEPAEMIKLQATLHSGNLFTPETRALNALVSRVFLALHRTDYFKRHMMTKVEKKISRVQKPAFIAWVCVQSVDLGDACPVLHNLRLREIKIDGDVLLSGDVKYTGGIKLVLTALARIDLGSHFRIRTVDLTLSTSLERLVGHMLFRLKPPPSNRIWFSFDGVPDMDIRVEPIVSQKQITYAFILRAIEERIRAVVTETLVSPNWDDIPFFDTKSQGVRGGIWQDEGDLSGPSEGCTRASTVPVSQKEISVELHASYGTTPGVTNDMDAMSASGRSIGRVSDSLKRRSLASLTTTASRTDEPSFQDSSDSQGLNSNLLAISSPALDDLGASSGTSTKLSQGNTKSWQTRASTSLAKDGSVDSSKSVRHGGLRRGLSSADDQHVISAEGHAISAEGSPRRSHSPETSAQPFVEETLPEGRFPKATKVTTSSSVSSFSTRPGRHASGLLAATSAAATAARNWGWSAIQTRTSAREQNPKRTARTDPIGRGQPLPPPGTPLPGPRKGIFAGNALAALGGSSSKPVVSSRPVGEAYGEIVDKPVRSKLQQSGKDQLNSPAPTPARGRSNADGNGLGSATSGFRSPSEDVSKTRRLPDTSGIYEAASESSTCGSQRAEMELMGTEAKFTPLRSRRRSN